MKPQRWLWDADRQGHLVHVTVRCGEYPSHRPLLGTLNMDPDQWEVLSAYLGGRTFPDGSKATCEIRINYPNPEQGATP